MGIVQPVGQNTLHGIDPAAFQAVVGPVLRAHGVEPVETVFRTEQGGWVLRVTVEVPGTTEPGGGVTVDLLTEISRDLSSALDVADIVPHRYNLEVSSPGLDRPLCTASDFRRFVGKLAKLHLGQPAADGQRVLRGPLVSATDDAVTIEVDGKPITTKLADVDRANLVFELSAQPKGARPSKNKKGRGQ